MAQAAVFRSTEWVPLKSFSIFRFGAPIEQYLSLGEEVLDVAEIEGTSALGGKVRGRYYSEEAGCYIEAAKGAVHQITTYDSCLVKGINIVGSMMGPVLELLEVNKPQWYLPYPREPGEKAFIIPKLGLELVVSMYSGAIYRVTMRPAVRDYSNREKAAVLGMGNVIDFRQARRALRSGRVELPPYRSFDW